jgi:hypothetical protein
MTGLAILVVGLEGVAAAAPTITLDQPLSESWTKSKKVSFSGTTNEPGLIKLYVYKAPSTGSPVWEGEPTSGTWKTPPIELPAAGQYTAAAQQTNQLGESGVSEPAVTFNVKTTAPAVSIQSPPSPSPITTPLLRGGAGVAAGDRPTVTVAVYAGSSVAGKPLRSHAVSTSGAEWSYPVVPALAEGAYTAQAVQEDQAGNKGTSAAVHFTIESGALYVTMLPVPSPSRNSTPTLRGTGSTAFGAEEAVVTISKLPQGPKVSYNVPVNLGGEWSFTPPAPLEDGSYVAKAIQKNGNNVGGSEEVPFAIDTRSPRVAITTPESGAILGLTTATFGGASGLEEGDLQSITLKVYAGSAAAGNPSQVLELTPAGGRWTASVGPLSNGIYTAVAEQPDYVGNIGTSVITFGIFVPGNGPPPVASFQWIPATPYVGQTVSLVSNSTDASSPITGSAWDLAGNGLFSPGGAVITTSFSRPGAHVVGLRVTDASGLSNVVTKTILVTVAPLRLVQPFPVVRIAGTQYRRGVRISLLSVQAPVGARIGVLCRGPGCPVKSKAQQRLSATRAASKNGGMALIEFRRFERALQAGAFLEIRVSVPGQIGKYTRFAVRRGKLPTRFDSCLDPTGVKPIACPTS